MRCGECSFPMQNSYYEFTCGRDALDYSINNVYQYKLLACFSLCLIIIDLPVMTVMDAILGHRWRQIIYSIYHTIITCLIQHKVMNKFFHYIILRIVKVWSLPPLTWKFILDFNLNVGIESLHVLDWLLPCIWTCLCLWSLQGIILYFDDHFLNGPSCYVAIRIAFCYDMNKRRKWFKIWQNSK